MFTKSKKSPSILIVLAVFLTLFLEQKISFAHTAVRSTIQLAPSPLDFKSAVGRVNSSHVLEEILSAVSGPSRVENTRSFLRTLMGSSIQQLDHKGIHDLLDQLNKKPTFDHIRKRIHHMAAAAATWDSLLPTEIGISKRRFNANLLRRPDFFADDVLSALNQSTRDGNAVSVVNKIELYRNGMFKERSRITDAQIHHMVQHLNTPATLGKILENSDAALLSTRLHQRRLPITFLDGRFKENISNWNLEEAAGQQSFTKKTPHSGRSEATAGIEQDFEEIVQAIDARFDAFPETRPFSSGGNVSMHLLYPHIQKASQKEALPKAAVVGGGISGLMTAFELMKRGYDIEIFEKRASNSDLSYIFSTHIIPGEVKQNALKRVSSAPVNPTRRKTIAIAGDVIDAMTQTLQGYGAKVHFNVEKNPVALAEQGAYSLVIDARGAGRPKRFLSGVEEEGVLVQALISPEELRENLFMHLKRDGFTQPVMFAGLGTGIRLLRLDKPDSFLERMISIKTRALQSAKDEQAQQLLQAELNRVRRIQQKAQEDPVQRRFVLVDILAPKAYAPKLMELAGLSDSKIIHSAQFRIRPQIPSEPFVRLAHNPQMSEKGISTPVPVLSVGSDSTPFTSSWADHTNQYLQTLIQNLEGFSEKTLDQQQVVLQSLGRQAQQSALTQAAHTHYSNRFVREKVRSSAGEEAMPDILLR